MKLLIMQFSLFSPHACSLALNISLSAIFWNTARLCSFLNVTDWGSNPYNIKIEEVMFRRPTELRLRMRVQALHKSVP
jgi:hypothetical protein